MPTTHGATSSTDDNEGTSSSSKVSGGPAELPLHVTEKILCCISPLESARLATVCKSWAATVSARLARRPAPHLFVHYLRPAEATNNRYGVIVPVPLDGSFDAPPAAIPAARMRRSSLVDPIFLECVVGATPSGRLAFRKIWSAIILLVNPVTGGVSRSIDIRKRPPQQVLAAGGGDDPLLSSTDDHAFVLSWRAAGGSDEWTSVTVPSPVRLFYDDIVSVAKCNGCFYVLHKDARVSVIDVTVPGDGGPHRQPVHPDHRLPQGRPPGGVRRRGGPLRPAAGCLQREKEETEKKQISFCKHRRIVVGFHVHSLDVKAQRWTKVNELTADRALFVGPWSSFAVRASETDGCRSNCIYFVCKKRKKYCRSCRQGTDEDGNT
jgi:hypothetical protein